MNETNAQNVSAETPADSDSNAIAIPMQVDVPEGGDELAAVAEHIVANYDSSVNAKPISFHFKTIKDEDTGTETKRDSIELVLPIPSVDGIIAILQAGGKQLQLLVDIVEAEVIKNARAMVNDDPAITARTIDVNKLSWEAIANKPRAERTGGGIPKETWDEFVEDYIAVMPEATGKELEKVKTAAKILGNKLNQVKTNFPVLEMLVGQLAIYAENSKNAEAFGPCVAFLLEKADKLLNISEEELLSAL